MTASSERLWDACTSSGTIAEQNGCNVYSGQLAYQPRLAISPGLSTGERPEQSNKLTYSLALAFDEEAQFDLMFYPSRLEIGLGGDHGIPVAHRID